MSEIKAISKFDNGSFSDKLFDICKRQKKGFMRKWTDTTRWTIWEGKYYGTYELNKKNNNWRLSWSPILSACYKEGSLADIQSKFLQEFNKEFKGNCLWNVAGRPEGFVKEEFFKWTMWVPSTLREREQICRLIVSTRSAKKAMKIWARKQWKGGELLNWDKVYTCGMKATLEHWLERLEGIEAPYKVGVPFWQIWNFDFQGIVKWYSYYHHEDNILRDTIRCLADAFKYNNYLARSGEQPFDNMWVEERVTKLENHIGSKEVKTWHDRAARA